MDVRVTLQQQHEELAREIAVQKMRVVQERRVHVSLGRKMTLLFVNSVVLGAFARNWRSNVVSGRISTSAGLVIQRQDPPRL